MGLRFDGERLIFEDEVLGTSISYTPPKRKKHWKEQQSDAERSEKLRKAQEKRDRKAKLKQNSSSL